MQFVPPKMLPWPRKRYMIAQTMLTYRSRQIQSSMLINAIHTSRRISSPEQPVTCAWVAHTIIWLPADVMRYVTIRYDIRTDSFGAANSSGPEFRRAPQPAYQRSSPLCMISGTHLYPGNTTLIIGNWGTTNIRNIHGVVLDASTRKLCPGLTFTTQKYLCVYH